MSKIKTTKWDAVDYLKTEEDIKYYLAAAFDDGDPELIAATLGDVAKARKLMGHIAKKSRVNRSSLYRSLSKEGTPYFRTINTAVNSLGYRLTIVPLAHSH